MAIAEINTCPRKAFLHKNLASGIIKASILRSIAKGDWAEQLAERFDVPEVTEAEEHFKSVLQTITDPELRHAVDAAAGRISRAYQILGFCAGRFSQDSRAQFI